LVRPSVPVRLKHPPERAGLQVKKTGSGAYWCLPLLKLVCRFGVKVCLGKTRSQEALTRKGEMLFLGPGSLGNHDPILCTLVALQRCSGEGVCRFGCLGMAGFVVLFHECVAIWFLRSTWLKSWAATQGSKPIVSVKSCHWPLPTQIGQWDRESCAGTRSN